MYLLKYKLHTKKNLAKDLCVPLYKEKHFAIDFLQIFLTIKREIKSQ